MCQHCGATFVTENGCYEHEKVYAFSKHNCGQCNKGFPFPGLLRSHERIHTKIGLSRCTNCPKTFPENQNMLAHQRTHHDVFTCTTCQHTFHSKPTLDQHVRGCHGHGWPTPCGQNVDWPHKLSSHKHSCKKCIAIQIKEDKKALKIAKAIEKSA